MPRTWRALPYGPKGQIQLKAPDFKAHKAQLEAGPDFKPPGNVSQELLAAFSMVTALEDDQLRFPMGTHYEIYRYAGGLAVKAPSGWTAFFPMESQKLPPRAPREASDPPEEDIRGQHLG
jgi:hypothetical protein